MVHFWLLAMGGGLEGREGGLEVGWPLGIIFKQEGNYIIIHLCIINNLWFMICKLILLFTNYWLYWGKKLRKKLRILSLLFLNFSSLSFSPFPFYKTDRTCFDLQSEP